MQTKKKSISIIASTVFVTVVAFQNCAKSGNQALVSERQEPVTMVDFALKDTKANSLVEGDSIAENKVYEFGFLENAPEGAVLQAEIIGAGTTASCTLTPKPGSKTIFEGKCSTTGVVRLGFVLTQPNQLTEYAETTLMVFGDFNASL